MYSNRRVTATPSFRKYDHVDIMITLKSYCFPRCPLIYEIALHLHRWLASISVSSHTIKEDARLTVINTPAFGISHGWIYYNDYPA